jgi:hypothetical protein
MAQPKAEERAAAHAREKAAGLRELRILGVPEEFHDELKLWAVMRVAKYLKKKQKKDKKGG